MEQLQEKQQIDEYIAKLETIISNLDIELERVRLEKEQLFEDYIDSLHKLYNISPLKETQ